MLPICTPPFTVMGVPIGEGISRMTVCWQWLQNTNPQSLLTCWAAVDGAEIADKVPAAYRATWGSNDVAGNAPGSPTYGGYGWRWCTTGDAALECERFCDSLPDCAGKTPATARRSPTPRSSMSHTALADVPSSRADRGVAAISAGQCCFPYRRRCPRSQLSDKSSSQSYKYYERDKPPGWGWPFLGALLLAAAAYAGGGVAASRVAGGGRGASGAQTHPHYQHWVGLRALVADGIAYAAGRRRSGDGGGGVGGTSGRRRVVVV